MSKLVADNRIITKCEMCEHEIDTLEDEMFCVNTIIMCVLCYEDTEYV